MMFDYNKFIQKVGHLQNEAPKYIQTVKPVLIDFAGKIWKDEWKWAENPITEIKTYAWIGSIYRTRWSPLYKNIYNIHFPILDSYGRFCVKLEQEDDNAKYYFRVINFLEHKYETPLSIFICLAEVGISTGLSENELREGLYNLYNYLKDNPITLETRGDKRPKKVDSELAPGVRYTKIVIDKID
ncbi:MAG: hypothetical protein AB7S75_05480 [Desulfococcaceae bacterium]